MTDLDAFRFVQHNAEEYRQLRLAKGQGKGKGLGKSVGKYRDPAARAKGKGKDLAARTAQIRAEQEQWLAEMRQGLDEAGQEFRRTHPNFFTTERERAAARGERMEYVLASRLPRMKNAWILECAWPRKQKQKLVLL